MVNLEALNGSAPDGSVVRVMRRITVRRPEAETPRLADRLPPLTNPTARHGDKTKSWVYLSHPLGVSFEGIFN